MLTCAVRPAGIIGEKDTTVTFKMFEHACNASPTVLRMQLGDNNNLYDFTYVGNISYAHMLAAERLLASYQRIEEGRGPPLDSERVDGEAFIITNDAPVYFWDIFYALCALVDKVVEPHQVLAIPEGLLNIVGAIGETILKLFGKTPRLTKRIVRYSCMTRFFSCEKAKHRLGYRPIVPFDEGLARAVGYCIESNRLAAGKKEQ